MDCYVEVSVLQQPKKVGDKCGDVYRVLRFDSVTYYLLADGLGSGIKAHLSAQFCLSRLCELLEQGSTFHKAFSKLVESMEIAKGTRLPYSALTACRVSSDGLATVLVYDMPSPVVVYGRRAIVAKSTSFDVGCIQANEFSVALKEGDGLLMVSDGVTESGLGTKFIHGWESSGVAEYVTKVLNEHGVIKKIASDVLAESDEINSGEAGDDCSVALVQIRSGKRLTILTGPPASQRDDCKAMKSFSDLTGKRIICGGTTSEVYAREMELSLTTAISEPLSTTPPQSFIDGVDLVTEGALTLNQVYRLYDASRDDLEIDLLLVEFLSLLDDADHVHFIVGQVDNDAHSDVSFLKRALLPRVSVVSKLSEKLRGCNKLVTIENI